MGIGVQQTRMMLKADCLGLRVCHPRAHSRRRQSPTSKHLDVPQEPSFNQDALLLTVPRQLARATAHWLIQRLHKARPNGCLRSPHTTLSPSPIPRVLCQYSDTVVLFCLFTSPRRNMAISELGHCGCSRDCCNSSPLNQVGAHGAGTDNPPRESQARLSITSNHHRTSSLGTRISDLPPRLFVTKSSF